MIQSGNVKPPKWYVLTSIFSFFRDIKLSFRSRSSKLVFIWAPCIWFTDLLCLCNGSGAFDAVALPSFSIDN